MSDRLENLRTEQQLVLQKPINRRDLLQSAAALLGTTATSGLATAVAGAAVTQGDAGQSTGKPTIVASDEDAIAETACGKVRGYIRDGIFTYKGIPYGESQGRAAEPQVPPLRFAPVGMTREGRLLFGRLTTGMDRVTNRYFAKTADPSTALPRISCRDPWL
jgi:hypothetical protein